MIEPTLVLALVAAAVGVAIAVVATQTSRNKYRKPERLASLVPPPPPPPQAPAEPARPLHLQVAGLAGKTAALFLAVCLLPLFLLVLPFLLLLSVMPAGRTAKPEKAEEEERRRAAAYSFPEDRPGYDAKKVTEREGSLELVLEEPEAKRPMTLRDIGDVPVKDALLYGALWYWVRSMLKSTR